MINRMKFIFSITVCLLLAGLKGIAGDITEFNRHFRLLPQPQKVELLKAGGLPYAALRNIVLVNTRERPVMPPMLAAFPLAASPVAGSVSLVIRASLSLPSPEGYILEIKDRQVTIQAAQQAGLFYGLQTLNQLMEDSRDQGIDIPSCRITDYPEIAYRAVHLDLKHHLDVARYYYDMIDRLAAVKVNAVIVELEDKLRYRKAPVVGAANAISVEEFAALSRYAHERFIEISPLVQGLGHASFILKHPEYKALRDDPASDWVFDPLNPATYALQFSLYEDAIAATPYGKYLHVGGDEVGALGKSALAKKSGMSAMELQLYWLRKVTDFAAAHHRIPIFWDDMVFKLAGLYESTCDTAISAKTSDSLWSRNQPFLDERKPLFPAGCTYMRWNYGDPKLPGNLRAIDWYKSNHLHVMAATATQCMSAMLSRHQSNFQPIKDFCQLTAEKKLDGILCTVWDDCSVHLETVWRGLYDFALFSWNYEDIPAEKAHALFRHRFFSPFLAPAVNEFQDSLETALSFWDTALVIGGDRENYHKDFKLLELPDISDPGSWTARNSSRLRQAALNVRRYDTIKSRISRSMQLAERNVYALSVMYRINELQVYPAKLLLLLETFDKAPAAGKKAAAAKLLDYVNTFGDIRAQLEKVFAETRMMGNPAGYMLDSNFHEHLANGTNNTDWMYMYELPMNEKITQWLQAHWQNPNGRNDTWNLVGFGGGGAMFCPAVSPFNPDDAFVACDMTGSFVTYNGGESWRMFNLKGRASYFVFDPSDSNTVYANSLALFKSTDRGNTWRLFYPAPAEVQGLVSKGDHASEIIVTRDSTRRKVLHFAVDPRNSEKLYAVIAIDTAVAFYTSDDGGKQWLKECALNNGTAEIYIHPGSPENDRTIYLAGSDGIRVKEHGAWKINKAPAGVKKLTRFTGGFDKPRNRYIIYAISGKSYFNPAGDAAGIYYTDNGGETWENRQGGMLDLNRKGAAPPEWRCIATSAAHPGTVYISYNGLKISADTTAAGIAKSEDYGKTWQISMQDRFTPEGDVIAGNFKGGWLNERFGPGWGENPFDIAVSPGNPGICYATDFGRTIKTVSGGKTWEQVYTRKKENGGWMSRGLEVTTGYSVVSDPFDTGHVFMANTDVGLMESMDGGQSWNSATKDNGVPPKWSNTTYSLVFDPQVKGKAWAAMSGIHDLPRPKMWSHEQVSAYTGGIVETTNSGKTWTPVSNDIGEAAITCILVDTASNQQSRTIYACAFGKGVYKSVDGGKTWKQKNHGISGREPFAWRIIKREQDGVLFLVVSRRSEDGSINNDGDGAVYRSADGAESWTKMVLPEGTNAPTSLVTDPGNPHRLVLSAWGRLTKGRFSSDTGGGIFLSGNDGKSWRQVLQKDQHIYDITFDPRNNTWYACGFNGGAYRSANGAQTWTRIKGYNFKWGKTVDPDPRNPGKIFIVTYGGGIWYGSATGDENAAEDMLTPLSL